MSGIIQQKFIMTIDGPGGSGKDSLAENLLASGVFDPATVRIFNTGNFSRAIAHETILSGVQPHQPGFQDCALQAMGQINFATVDPRHLFTAQVEQIVSTVAAIPEIRAGFVQKLPEIIEAMPEEIVLVLGRITGSLCKDAQVKLYLETHPDVCAHRRAFARSQKGEDYETVKHALIERNKNDLTSWNNHYAMPADTVVINTDDLSEQDVLKTVLTLGHRFI